MNKLSYSIMALMTLIIGSCDAHRDMPDLGVKVGDVLCSDGEILNQLDWKESEKEPVGIIFHVNNNPDIIGRGYAVYLRDLNPVAFADSLGIKQGSSTDIFAHDGNENTFAIMTQQNCSSPMAEAVFDLWRYGQSSYIPSIAQLRLMKDVRNIINVGLENIGGDTLPDIADECWYWSSTEVEGQETAKAWLYSISQGAMQETPKTQPHKVRPIITIRD